MKKSVLKKLVAIICLILICICSINSIELKKRRTPIEKLQRNNQDTIVQPSGKTNKKDSQANKENSVAHRKVNSEDGRDWTKAPNSYLFDPIQNNEGVYVPVKKAYAMWQQDKILGALGIPSGQMTADVL